MLLLGQTRQVVRIAVPGLEKCKLKIYQEL